MKNLLVAIIVAVSVVVSNGQLAGAVTTTVTVDGTVGLKGYVRQNGAAVKGANVHFGCTVSGQEVNYRNDTTSSTGWYNVSFNSPACLSGGTITLTATSGSASAMYTHTFSAPLVSFSAQQDLDLVSVSVPEYSALTTVAALTAAGGALYLHRRMAQK